MFKKLNENFKSGLNRKLLVSSFLIYFSILIWGILLKFMNYRLISCQYKYIDETIITRFKFLFEVSTFNSPSSTTINVVVNLLFFLPLGMYLPLLFNKYNFFRDLVIGMLLSFSFELIQAFTRTGCLDIVDVICNVGGLIIGSIIFYFLKPITSDFVINYIQFGVVIVCVSTLIYAIISVPLHIEYLKPFFDFDSHPYIWK